MVVQRLQQWLAAPEGERLEFKEAKQKFEFDNVGKYCSALANEGGGLLVLGVTNHRPRKVVGTAAFAEPGNTVSALARALRIRIDWEEIQHPDGRVLVFEAPARPVGLPVGYKGIYYSRSGDELRPLSERELRAIFAEGVADYSAEICEAAESDLEPSLVEKFREMWARKSGSTALLQADPRQLLEDAELLVNGRVTLAALILMGRDSALGRYLSQAELVFEYRGSEASTPYQQRVEFRRGVLGVLDEAWKLIDLRNEVLQYQEGFFRGDIRVFNESVVREAILNALAHRDYRIAGSVFVRQYPRKLEVVSPGGFPPGITAQNILWRQFPRNRRLSEAFAKCGLVERSGQGANRMFEESIKEGKPRPDFTGTDDYQVELTLRGEIQNPDFLRFLQKIGRDRLATFSTRDILILDTIQREERVPEDLRERLPHLLAEGVIERIGRGRGARLILSRKYHAFVGHHGLYTRRRGLDRETNKALLMKHLDERSAEGAPMKELQEVLPALSRRQILVLLKELKDENRVHSTGERRGARWRAGAGMKL